ncbi:MAG: META domain-containing protein [Bacteroidales bacterium]|jgi:heat shock protein HslJ|nr:META domain-containing protein [Bacteroidales bacterium]MDD4395145.1 META domain-containing protein [Bacteroidales bacterium]
MKKIIFIALAFMVGITACQTEKKVTQDTSNADAPLQGTRWELTNINCAPIDKSPEVPFIIFNNDGGFSGNLGCNSFFGTYFADSKKIEIKYSGSTKKLCSEMTLEKEFSKALKNDINNYIIVEKILIIKNKEQEVLRFKATPNISE